MRITSRLPVSPLLLTVCVIAMALVYLYHLQPREERNRVRLERLYTAALDLYLLERQITDPSIEPDGSVLGRLRGMTEGKVFTKSFAAQWATALERAAGVMGSEPPPQAALAHEALSPLRQILNSENVALEWDRARHKRSLYPWLTGFIFLALGLLFWSLSDIRRGVHRPLQRIATMAQQIEEGTIPALFPRFPGSEWRGVSRALSVITQTMESERQSHESQSRVRESRLEQVVADLKRANRLKSEFLANMSHELRTPLNSIVGYTALMRDEVYGSVTPKQREALEKVRAGSQHLLRLINDVLDLSRVESGKMPLQVEAFKLTELHSAALETFAPLAQAKGIQLVVDPVPPDIVVRQDRGKLQQVLYNLLSNAVKFTAQGGVHVTTELQSQNGGPRDHVEISVRDTGIGVRPEDQKIIFEEFRQVDSTATRAFGGSGLGLAISRNLMNLLRGHLKLESRYGEGSTFTMTFPRMLQA